MKRIIIMVTMSILMMTSGGIITAGVNADEPEQVQVVEQIEQDIVEPEIVEIEPTGPETVEPETDVTEQETKEDNTPAGIIESQTGLAVDSVKLVDSYGNWAFYEVFADGDIYAVTIKAGNVDVCQILN